MCAAGVTGAGAELPGCLWTSRNGQRPQQAPYLRSCVLSLVNCNHVFEQRPPESISDITAHHGAALLSSWA